MKAYTKQRPVEVTPVTKDNAEIMATTLNNLFGDNCYSADNLVGCYVILDGGCVQVMNKTMFNSTYDCEQSTGEPGVAGMFGPGMGGMGFGMAPGFGMADGLAFGFPSRGFVPKFIGVTPTFGKQPEDKENIWEAARCGRCAEDVDDEDEDDLDDADDSEDEDSEDEDRDGEGMHADCHCFGRFSEFDRSPWGPPYGPVGMGMGFGPFSPMAPMGPMGPMGAIGAWPVDPTGFAAWPTARPKHRCHCGKHGKRRG